METLQPSQREATNVAVGFLSKTCEGKEVKVSVVMERSRRTRAYHANGRIGLGRRIGSGHEEAVGGRILDYDAVHEFGHAIETQKPGVREAAREFLAYRVGDEPLTDLGRVPGGRSMKGEKGRKDNFDRHFPGVMAYYVGSTMSELPRSCRWGSRLCIAIQWGSSKMILNTHTSL